MSVSIYDELNEEQIELIKSQICRGATNDELKLFLYTAKKAGVDPLLKQIYSVRRGGRMVIQMGIDGFRAVAARQNNYAPGNETFEYDTDGNLISATVTVYQLLPNGVLHPFSKTAYWSEYAQYQIDKLTGKKTLSQFWKQYPRVMLAKCAEAAALRKGWPQIFSKIYAPEELQQVEKEEHLTEMIEEDSHHEEEIELKIPKDIDKENVMRYFNVLSEELDRPIYFFKKRAEQFPEKFWSSYHKWMGTEPKKAAV